DGAGDVRGGGAGVGRGHGVSFPGTVAVAVAVVVVDVAERVRAFVAELREVVGETLVAWVDEVEIVR
ncbi:hypothetical protein ACFCWQ_41530, partial [Streptomyces sp. NPDC056401]